MNDVNKLEMEFLESIVSVITIQVSKFLVNKFYYFYTIYRTAVPGEEPLRARKRTNNKLNPHMTPGPGIAPGTH